MAPVAREPAAKEARWAMSAGLTRRRFLRAVAAASMIVPAHALSLGGGRPRPPLEL